VGVEVLCEEAAAPSICFKRGNVSDCCLGVGPGTVLQCESIYPRMMISTNAKSRLVRATEYTNTNSRDLSTSYLCDRLESYVISLWREYRVSHPHYR